jgi:hypothetical protein
LSQLHRLCSFERIVLNDELRRMQKEAVFAYLKLTFQYLPGQTSSSYEGPYMPVRITGLRIKNRIRDLLNEKQGRDIYLPELKITRKLLINITYEINTHAYCDR